MPRAVFIDGDLQLSEFDEFVYHEALAHVPLAYVARRPADVLIVGGGDGGLCARCLQHEWVRSLTLVDIDAAIIATARRHFPALATACFDDPRTTTVVADASAWLAERANASAPAAFDALLIDSTDFGASTPLRTSAFYAAGRAVLRAGGVLAHNFASPTWTLLDPRGGARPHDPTVSMPPRARLLALGESFGAVRVFSIFAPMYGGWYSAALASDAPIPDAPPDSFAWPPARAPPAGHALAPRYYSLAMHAAAFALPPFAIDGWGLHATVAADAAVDVDVVVVGGGVAGVSAAAALSRLGVPRVLILEAAHLGGVPTNVGASWIHHAEGNPILKLAQRGGCALELTTNANASFYSADGQRLDPDLAAPTMARLHELMTRFLRRRSARRRGARPEARGLDLASELVEIDEKYNRPEGADGGYSAAERAYIELHAFRNVVLDYTADASDLRADDVDEELYGGFGRDALVTDDFFTCAFARMIDRADGVEVRMSTAVTGVRTLRTPWGDRAHVTTADGATVRARRVLVTVPLGVLKTALGAPPEPDGVDIAEAETAWRLPRAPNPLTTFEPPLPPSVAAAVRAGRVGRAIRVALEFGGACCFWADGGDAPRRDLVLEGRRLGPFGEGEHLEFTAPHARAHVLVAEADGAYAATLSRLADAELAEALRARLSATFGEKTPRIVRLHARRFMSEPLAAGTFSYNSIGPSAAYRGDHGALHFGGEHTSPLFPGTVDGAYFSGVAAAHAIGCGLGELRLGQRTPMTEHVDAELLADVWRPNCTAAFGGAPPEGWNPCDADFYEIYLKCRRPVSATGGRAWMPAE